MGVVAGRARPAGAAGQAERAAEDAHRSKTVERLARLGLACRGVVWLVVGLLALSVLRGARERTDRNGALKAIAEQPLGEVLLVVLVLGFAGYALWRALSALVGHDDEEGVKRAGARLVSAAKAGLYGFLAVSTATFLLTRSSSADRTRSTTAEVMAHGGGRFLVGAVGLVVIGVGVGLVVRAVMQKHAEKLEQYRIPDRFRTAARAIGTAGLTGRGLVLALVGGFLLKAAVQFDAKEARGLDAALQALAGEPYGKVLFAVAVLGMLAYAAWSFVEAAYRRL